jgi:hypothetical protein
MTRKLLGIVVEMTQGASFTRGCIFGMDIHWHVCVRVPELCIGHLSASHGVSSAAVSSNTLETGKHNRE